MPRRVLILQGADRFDVVETAAPSEHSLQEVVKANPQLLPADDLGFDGDLLVVGRETSLASGAIDLVCLARTGDVVLVEFKTGPQNPDFRHALAQVVDYGSDLWRMTIDDFDRGVVQRYLRSSHADKAVAHTQSLDDLLTVSAWQLSPSELEALLARLEDVLLTGDFTFVIAAQRFTPTMATTLDYLNVTTRYGRYFLVEVVQFEGADLTAHAAQIVAAPPRAPTSGGSADKANEADFLDSFAADDVREAMHDILTSAQQLGLEAHWGAKGASLRLPVPDRVEPLSVAWVFPGAAGWMQARHLTLGVDHASLVGTPSVQTPVEHYLREVAVIPEGQHVSKPEGYVFAPHHLSAVRDQAIAALSHLTDAVRRGGEGTNPEGRQ